MDDQLRAWKMQRRERHNQEEACEVTYHENKTKIALAKAELRRIEAEAQAEPRKTEAENAFRQCLLSNMDSSDLGPSEIPSVCENLAKRLRILGGGSIVKELTEIFQE